MNDLLMTIEAAQKQLEAAWKMLYGINKEKVNPCKGVQKAVEECLAGKPVAGFVVLSIDHDRETFYEMLEGMQKRGEQACKLLGVSTDRIEIIKKILPYEDEDGGLRWASTIGWKLKLTNKERKRMENEEKETVSRAMETMDALYKKLEVAKNERADDAAD